MRLLIVTQTVDRSDPVLGFFHQWIEEFAKRCESVLAVGQRAGSHDLPGNVRVVSLGKEKQRGRMGQVLRFWSLQWKLRGDYDRVFVHMTPVWVLLGAPVWIMLRKPAYLWYEIRRGSRKLFLALRFVRKVFSATERGLPVRSKKLVVTGHGIDTERFCPAEGAEPERRGLVAVGRVTRIKRLEDIIASFAQASPELRLTVAGGPVTEDDETYAGELRSLIARLSLNDRVAMRWVPHGDMPRLLRRSDVLLHAAGGGLDKAVLEAMACGCLVLSAGEATKGVLPPRCRCARDEMPEALRSLLALSREERSLLRRELRTIVERNHDLRKLIPTLMREMSA